MLGYKGRDELLVRLIPPLAVLRSLSLDLNPSTSSDDIFAEVLAQNPHLADLLSLDPDVALAQVSRGNVQDHCNKLAIEWAFMETSSATEHFAPNLFHDQSPLAIHQARRSAKGKCPRRMRSKISQQPCAAAMERIDKRMRGICTVKSCKKAALANRRRCQGHLDDTNAARRRLRKQEAAKEAAEEALLLALPNEAS